MALDITQAYSNSMRALQGEYENKLKELQQQYNAAITAPQHAPTPQYPPYQNPQYPPYPGHVPPQHQQCEQGTPINVQILAALGDIKSLLTTISEKDSTCECKCNGGCGNGSGNGNDNGNCNGNGKPKTPKKEKDGQIDKGDTE